MSFAVRKVLSSKALPLVLSACLGAASAAGQGVLTVAPQRTTTALAGTGTVGVSGNGGPATSATLAYPSAVAYDAAGDLLIADANNHVIRQVTAAGVISTFAGTPGVAGFGGDGGAAISAYLDTPTGVAVDASGNVYIADSHNARIRKVSAAGVISTMAGSGTVGFSGDGGAAASAQLALPSAVAVDGTGNVYIADTNNNRIREVSGGTITTLAGGTEQFYSGDGGLASAAFLNHPTGVAVDASGNVYIADRENQSIRVINATTKAITTYAGSGPAASFAGGFSGDNAASTAAGLAKPTGVSVDASGNVYVADTNNQRIRQVSGGVISTIAGTGEQGLGGNGGAATSAILNAPRMAAPDAAGNLALADTLNQEVRSGPLGVLTYMVQAPGTASAAPQAITLTNSGTGALTVPAPALVAAALVTGGSCAAYPLSLAAGASCTQNVAFAPATAADTSGSVSYSGAGFTTQKVLLSGATDTLNIQVANVQVLYGTPTAPLSASVAYAHAQNSPPNGAVTFRVDGGTAVAATCVAAGTSSLTCSATATTGALSLGLHTITASLGIYSGSGNLQVQQTPGSIPVCTLGAAQGTSASGTGSNASFTLSVPASCVGAPGHTLATTIDWDADHTQAQDSVTGSPATHVYSASGTYRIVLTAVDVSPGLTTQFIGSATESVAVVIPPPVAPGADTSSSTTVAQQVTPIPPTTVTFVCTGVTGTLSTGQVLPLSLPSQYGISCSPYTATVSSTSQTPVTITIHTSTSTTAMNYLPGQPRVLTAFVFPFFGLVLFGGGFLLPRNRRKYAGWLRVSGTMLAVCCTLCSCGGSFTAPAVNATPTGTYYLTVNEFISGGGAAPTGFIQTSLIVPLLISK